MFSPIKPIYEAPVLGAVAGAFLGGGGTLAGMLSVGGLIGGIAGAVGGSLLDSALKPPKLESAIAPQPQPQQQQVPQTPPAPAIPAVPAAPSASPVTGGGLGAGSGPGGSDTPVDVVSTPVAEPFTPGEASPPTTEEVVKGELQRKRRGRVSTILTTPESRLREGEEEPTELLGG